MISFFMFTFNVTHKKVAMCRSEELKASSHQLLSDFTCPR